MRKSKIRRGAEAVVRTLDRQYAPALDLGTAEPDSLRNSVREALSRLSEWDRPNVNDRLLSVLENAGVNIGQDLLLLGIPTTVVEELTAPEIATLVRYVRINEPRAMVALVPVLSEVFAAHGVPAGDLEVSSRAA